MWDSTCWKPSTFPSSAKAVGEGAEFFPFSVLNSILLEPDSQRERRGLLWQPLRKCPRINLAHLPSHHTYPSFAELYISHPLFQAFGSLPSRTLKTSSDFLLGANRHGSPWFLTLHLICLIFLGFFLEKRIQFFLLYFIIFISFHFSPTPWDHQTSLVPGSLCRSAQALTFAITELGFSRLGVGPRHNSPLFNTRSSTG